MKRNIYCSALVSLVLLVALSVCAFAAPAVVDSFETAAETVSIPSLSAEENVAVEGKTMPLILDGIRGANGAASLMSEDERYIYLWDAYIPSLFVGQEEFLIYLYFDGVCDAKYKLEVSIVDENGVPVAKQVNSSYYFFDDFEQSLVYDLELVSGAEVSAEKTYKIKLDYTGTYDFLSDIESANVYFYDDIAIIDSKIVDLEEGIVSLNVVGLDPEKEYLFTCFNRYTESDVGAQVVSVNGTRYTLRIKNPEQCVYEENYGDEIDYEFWGNILLKSPADDGDGYVFDWCCEWGVLENLTQHGDYYDDEWIEGIDCGKGIGLDSQSYSFYLYEKEDYSVYTSTDYKNFDIYILDSVTAEKVADLSDQEFYSKYGEYYCELKFSKALVKDREYYLIVDDGYTIRVASLVATDAPMFEFCGFNDGISDSYYGGTIPDAETVYVMIIDPMNMPDASKLSAVTTDYDTGDTVHVSVANSITTEGNSVYFKMRAPGYEQGVYEWLGFSLFYDGALIYNYELYCDGSFGEGDYEEDPYVYSWVNNVYGTPDATYLTVDMDYYGYDVSDFDYLIYFPEEEQTYNGTYTVMYGDDYYSRLLIEFPVSFPGEEKEFNFVVAQDNYAYDSETCYCYYDTEEYTFIYDTTTKNDGYTYFYGIGLEDGNTYKLFNMDRDGIEHSITLTKIRNQNVLRAKNEEVSALSFGDYELYPILEINNIPTCLVEIYGDFLRGHNPNLFYSKYISQDHRFAVLNMPTALYTQYKVAESKEALKSMSYAKIKNEVLYTLPDVGGEYVIYAQFKDSKGNESEIMRAYVSIAEPSLVWNETPTNIYYTVNEDETKLIIDFNFTTNFEGYGYVYFYGQNEDFLGEADLDIHYIRNDTELVITTSEFSVEDIAKIQLYVDAEYEDSYSSFYFEEIYDVDFELIERYTKHALSDGFILFDNLYQQVSYIETELEAVVIPSSIGGRTVKSIGTFQVIDPYACPNLTSLQIPACVTEISPYAFENIRDIPLNLTLKVRDGSYAHEYAKQYAEEYGFDYELILYLAGDVTGDDTVDLSDAIYVLQYSMFPDDYPLDYAGSVDFTGDGYVDLADAILLLQHSMFPEDYPIE